MEMLVQPLTIEDWFGNVYLIKPIENKNHLPAITNRSSIIFTRPNPNERKSKMIKKIMVATTVDKASISSLLRNLRNQLRVDLNLDNVTVFKMVSKTSQAKSMRPTTNNGNVKIKDDQSINEPIEDVPNEIWSNVENSFVNCVKSLSSETKTDQPNLFTTSENNRSEEYAIPKDEGSDEETLCDIICPKSKSNVKFTFFTCWYADEPMRKNYFLLPDDNLVNMTFKLAGYRINETKKLLLLRYLKMIEKTADSRIKFKSITQSQRVTQLFYRKIIIYAKDRNGIWISLELIKEHLSDVIKNAVFYQPTMQSNPLISPELLSELKRNCNEIYGDERLHYASEKLLPDFLTGAKPPKLSKIPVLLSQKFRERNKRKLSQTPLEVLPNFVNSMKSRVRLCNDNYKFYNNTLNKPEYSDAKLSLMIDAMA